MKINRTEQHLINQNNKIWKIIDQLCFKSKNVFNYANYILRQEFINNNKYIKYNKLANIIKDTECYKELGSNVGQQTLKILDKSWKSFFISIKDWSKHKEKYNGKPKLPKYKKQDGRFILGIDSNKFSIKDNCIRFSWKPLKPLNNKFKTNISGTPIQIRFIPNGNNYVMELVYEINVPETQKQMDRIISIDLGVENLATITNNIGLQPIVIKGKVLKSINQYYNKQKALYQSILEKINKQNISKRIWRLTTKRGNKIKDYMHKSSKYIINYCKINNIDTIVIGHNNEWKQNINIGKQNNQNFTTIPFNTLVNQIKYKAENLGIKIIIQEESFTSKASFLDNDVIPILKTNIQTEFSGKRIKRGLYQSKENTLINADVNASYNILKKAVPKAFVDGIEVVGLHPLVIKI